MADQDGIVVVFYEGSGMNIDINSVQDLENHKTYTQNYGQYLTNIEDPRVKTDIIKHIRPAESHPEFFTDDEIAWIQGFAFSRCSRLRINPNGTFFVSGNMRGVYEKYADKFEQILPGCGKSPVVKGNYFITPEQYGLHNDSIRKSDYTQTFEDYAPEHEQRRWVPWRNIIIPLMVSPAVDSHIVFFKQRHISWFTVYDHGAKADKYPADYPVITDYSKIQFETCEDSQSIEQNTIPYNKKHYDQYLSYTPYRRLTGLSEESTFEWHPKCPMVFDCFQLHATNQGIDPNQWKIKMGLLLCFFREIK